MEKDSREMFKNYRSVKKPQQTKWKQKTSKQIKQAVLDLTIFT